MLRSSLQSHGNLHSNDVDVKARNERHFIIIPSSPFIFAVSNETVLKTQLGCDTIDSRYSCRKESLNLREGLAGRAVSCQKLPRRVKVTILPRPIVWDDSLTVISFLDLLQLRMMEKNYADRH